MWKKERKKLWRKRVYKSHALDFICRSPLLHFQQPGSRSAMHILGSASSTPFIGSHNECSQPEMKLQWPLKAFISCCKKFTRSQNYYRCPSAESTTVELQQHDIGPAFGYKISFQPNTDLCSAKIKSVIIEKQNIRVSQIFLCFWLPSIIYFNHSSKDSVLQLENTSKKIEKHSKRYKLLMLSRLENGNILFFQ